MPNLPIMHRFRNHATKLDYTIDKLNFLILISKDQTMLQLLSQKVASFSLLLSFFAVALLTMFWIGCKAGRIGKNARCNKDSGKRGKIIVRHTSTSGKNLDTGRGVLEAMAEAYRTAKSYNDKGNRPIPAESGDQKIDQKIDFSVAFQRPNKLRMEAYMAKVVIDGKKFYASIDDLPGQVLEKTPPPN